MNRPSAGIYPICFSYILIIILLCETTRPVQSIALSSLCGHFGHSCFGGNWGKRELPIEEYSQSSMARNNEPTTAIVDENSMDNFLLEQLRMNLLRQRLRQLLE